MNATVVVTGASAGTGRAIAREFAAQGARIALLARGRAGLEAAAADVKHAGGQALPIPVDVANFDEINAAAQRTEDELGPIDVWVNVAFTSVFAPFRQISPEEFRRVTEVTYLGFVYGTMAALQRMAARDRGTIVQVGSALGERAIPLQSAYCGAKHAVNGFTESLRVELMHDHSNVHVTLVQMPALNTPQFSWVRSRLPCQPQPVPPIYQPELAARAVVYAAEHPRRKQYWVGASTVATLVGQRLAAPLLDRYLARTGYSSQQTDQPKHEWADNLWQPLDDTSGHDYGSHGIFDDDAHETSRQWWLRRHTAPLLVAAGAVVAAAVGAGVIRGAERIPVPTR
jgi:NAD(P)-dependent dehydrogenase (short-subunit alcohol dehydrogenase family)